MFHIIKQIYTILNNKLRLIFIILWGMMILGGLLEILGIGLVLPVVAAFTDVSIIQSNAYLKFCYEWLNPKSNIDFIIIFSIIIVVFYCIKFLFMTSLLILQSFFSYKSSTYITSSIFNNYIHMPYYEFIQKPVADILNRITESSRIGEELLMPLLIVLSESIVVLLMLLALCIISPLIATMIFIVFIVFFSLLYLPIHKIIAKVGKNYTQAGKRSFSYLENVMYNIKEVKSANAENYFYTHYKQEQQKQGKSICLKLTLGNLPRFALETLGIILIMGTIIIVLMRGISPSWLIIYASIAVASIFRLMPSISRIQYNILRIRNMSYLFTLLIEMLEKKYIQENSNITIPFEKNITIDNISFAYDHGQQIFQNFSLEIKKMEVIGFVGKTGCGKTTLLDCILGFLPVQQGQILVDGINIQENLSNWRSQIGYVSQNIYLNNDSIRHNIAFATEDSDIDEEKLYNVMEIAQIADFVRSLPEKDYTMVGDLGVRLSGGQRQRIAIARALYQNPKLLVLDEATSALDDDTEKAFIDALYYLKGKLTILMIAHRKSSLVYCDRIIDIEQNINNI